MKNPILVVIVGETASGKSDLAMRIASKYIGEIISADSWTVYKGFDIGTAKPTKSDQAKVQHHLLDVAIPEKGFNAAQYKKLANNAIVDIASRGKLPVMVGGTGLYIDSVIFDYSFLDDKSKYKREDLNKLELNELLDLAEQNKINLDNVDTRNKRRIIRAIETNGQKPMSQPLRKNTLIIGLKNGTEELEQKILLRVQKMITKGLESEVKELSEKYGWNIEAMKGIGYREWKEYFDGKQNLEQTQQRIVRTSLGLAKKQRTWFKRNNIIQWVDNEQQADKAVEHFLYDNLIQ